MSSYQMFVKEHMGKMPSSMLAKEKMAEIGKMWREHKEGKPMAKSASVKKEPKEPKEPKKQSKKVKGSGFLNDVSSVAEMAMPLVLGFGEKMHEKKPKHREGMLSKVVKGGIVSGAGDMPMGGMVSGAGTRKLRGGMVSGAGIRKVRAGMVSGAGATMYKEPVEEEKIKKKMEELLGF